MVNSKSYVFLTIIHTCCFTLQSNYRLLLSAPVNKASWDSAHASLVGVLESCSERIIIVVTIIIIIIIIDEKLHCQSWADINKALQKAEEVNISDAAKLFS